MVLELTAFLTLNRLRVGTLKQFVVLPHLFQRLTKMIGVKLKDSVTTNANTNNRFFIRQLVLSDRDVEYMYPTVNQMVPVTSSGSCHGDFFFMAVDVCIVDAPFDCWHLFII
jgi:hypothetical protein